MNICKLIKLYNLSLNLTLKQAAANTEEDIPLTEITIEIFDFNDVATLVINDNCAGETDPKNIQLRSVTAYFY